MVEAVGVSLQNYSPAKVEATPRQPFDYNGNLSHTLRVGKTQMTHPTYALVGNSGRDFTSQQRKTENFANTKRIKTTIHCLAAFHRCVYCLSSGHQ